MCAAGFLIGIVSAPSVDAQDLPVVLERAIEGDLLKFLYLDGRDFCGHYLEYVWATDERWVQMGGR